MGMHAIHKRIVRAAAKGFRLAKVTSKVSDVKAPQAEATAAPVMNTTESSATITEPIVTGGPVQAYDVSPAVEINAPHASAIADSTEEGSDLPRTDKGPEGVVFAKCGDQKVPVEEFEVPIGPDGLVQRLELIEPQPVGAPKTPSSNQVFDLTAQHARISDRPSLSSVLSSGSRLSKLFSPPRQLLPRAYRPKSSCTKSLKSLQQEKSLLEDQLAKEKSYACALAEKKKECWEQIRLCGDGDGSRVATADSHTRPLTEQDARFYELWALLGSLAKYENASRDYTALLDRCARKIKFELQYKWSKAADKAEFWNKVRDFLHMEYREGPYAQCSSEGIVDFSGEHPMPVEAKRPQPRVRFEEDFSDAPNSAAAVTEYI